MKVIAHLAMLAQLAVAAVVVRAADVELISRASQGSIQATAGGSSVGATFSPDGRFVMFSSAAPDLVNLPGDGVFHLYMVDQTTQAIQLVDTNTVGGFGNADAEAGGMSGDNRFVVFQSRASNLGPADANGMTDVYLRDLTTGQITLVSHNAEGADAGDQRSLYPQISNNGDWVVFESFATDLISGDTNSAVDLFAWKRADGSIRVLSNPATARPASVDVDDFSISADSRFVLFTASGTNLVANKISAGDVYLRELETGSIRWVSAQLTNVPGFTNAHAGNAVLSTHGRFVFFVALTNTTRAVVRVDLNDDSIIKVSDNFTGESTFLDEGVGPLISDNGQFAAFVTGTNVMYWSGTTGAAEPIAAGGIAPTGRISELLAMSHDGTKIVFLSSTNVIIDGLGNGQPQLYIYDATTRQTKLITHNTSGAPTFDNDVATASFSADDSAVLFETLASDLVLGDSNNARDIFSYKVADGTIRLVSSSRAESPSLTAPGTSSIGAGGVSADGRFVAFVSLAKLSANDTNTTYDVYVRDRKLQTNILVSAGPDGFSMGAASSAAAISSDGNLVIFESNAVGLAGPADTKAVNKIYARDLRSGVLRNISTATIRAVTRKLLSRDGRFVFFDDGPNSYRYDLSDDTTTTLPLPIVSAQSATADGTTVAGSGSQGIYLMDFATRTPTLIAGGTGAALSSDGSVLVVASTASASISLWMTNRVTGETNYIAGGRKPSISVDARIIAYEVLPTAPGSVSDVYYFDRVTGQSNLVSRAFGKTTGGNESSSAAVVSADGRFIAFESWASDLVASDGNKLKDVFVYDRITDKLIAASHAPGSPQTANSFAANPAISADGSLVAFTSTATDFVAGDLNDSADVFALALGFAIESVVLDGDGLVSLRWTAVAGQKYQVQYTASLDAPAWADVGSEITGIGATISAPMEVAGFYRVRLVQ